MSAAVSSATGRFSAAQVTTLVLCAFTFVIEGYDIQSMALAIPYLSSSWSIPAANFSLSISAMVLSSALSCAFLAPFGDAYGRKRVVVLGLIAMGGCVCATASATSIAELQIWRFLAGIGFGATAPNVMALIAEQLPANRRSFFVTLATVNMSVGGLIGAVCAPWLVQSFSWPAIFLAGGAPAILVALIMMRGIAETRPRIHAAATPLSDEPATRVPTIRDVLAPSWRRVTIALWCLWTLNSIMTFLMLSWAPTMLTAIGWSMSDASRGTAMLYLGGIPAALLFTWLLDRGRASLALITSYVATALSFTLIVLTSSDSVLLWSLMLLPIGASLVGGHYALNAIAVTIYPSAVRATGVGWANALNRLGSIAGSLAGGVFLYLGLGTIQTLSLLIVPATLSIVLIVNLERARRHTTDVAPERGALR